MIAWGGLGILIGFLGVLVSGIRDFRWAWYTFFILQGVNTIAMGLQRFLICEAGILSSERVNRIKLYRWDDILSYDLENGKLRLKLRDNSPLGERWITCRPRVRRDYQEELDAVLDSRSQRLKLPLEV